MPCQADTQLSQGRVRLAGAVATDNSNLTGARCVQSTRVRVHRVVVSQLNLLTVFLDRPKERLAYLLKPRWVEACPFCNLIDAETCKLTYVDDFGLATSSRGLG